MTVARTKCCKLVFSVPLAPEHIRCPDERCPTPPRECCERCPCDKEDCLSQCDRIYDHTGPCITDCYVTEFVHLFGRPDGTNIHLVSWE